MKSKVSEICIVLCVILGVALFIFFEVKLTNNTNKEKNNNEVKITEKKTKTYLSYDNKVNFTFPNTWIIYENKKTLNSQANLEVKEKHKYFVLISQNKKSYSNNFGEYIKFVINENSKIYNKKSTNISNLKSLNNIKYVDYTSELDGVNIFIRNYVINGKTNFHQVLLWGLYKDKDNLINEFDEIVESIKEV